MNLYTVDSGHFKLDGGAMHGVVPKSLWQKFNPADDLNLCSWAMRCLLIETGDRLILVDTGIGNKQDERFFGHYHLHGDTNIDSELKKHGFHRSEITDVFLTHLHFDHVGGAINRVGEKLVLAFENAVYWSNQAHWDWAVHPNAREKASFLKENILPIQESGQLKMITCAEGEEWLPGIKVRYVNGHTEAMMLPLLSYKGQNILYCADLLPSLAHLPLPWIMSYDMRPLDTLAEKTTTLKEAAEKDWLLYFEHDAHNEMCRLQQTEKGIRHQDTLLLSDL